MEPNTNDLSKFGYVELKEAAKLLTAYCENVDVIPWDGVKLEFNPNSGSVFLIDEYFNVAMLHTKSVPQYDDLGNIVCYQDVDNLELWYRCPICGHEGFLDDMWHHNDEYDEECQKYLKDIGAVQEA